MRLQFSLTIFSALASFVAAAPLSHDEIQAKAAAGLRLLKLSDDVEPVWKTEDEKLDIMRQNIKFVCSFRLTCFSSSPKPFSLMSRRSGRRRFNGRRQKLQPRQRPRRLPVCRLHLNSLVSSPQLRPPDPAPSHQSAVTPLLSTLSTTNMNNYLTSLTAFNNRYYRATTGRAASQWILDTVTNVNNIYFWEPMYSCLYR